MRRAMLMAVAAAAVISMLLVPATDALTIKSTLTIKMGAGAARRITYTTGTGSLYVNLKSLTPGTWNEALYTGVCSSLGTRVAVLPGLVVGSSHAVARTNTLTAAQATGRTLRLVHGSTILCGTFGAVVPPAPATIVVTVPGSRYKTTASTIQPNAVLTPNADGSLTIATTDDHSAHASIMAVGYDLPPGIIPTGRTVASLDTRVCANASGFFFEAYGPTGSNPREYEVPGTAFNGCWTFTGAPGTDFNVVVKQFLTTTVTVLKVEYTLHLK
jgi:hypothetical protein